MRVEGDGHGVTTRDVFVQLNTDDAGVTGAAVGNALDLLEIRDQILSSKLLEFVNKIALARPGVA